MASDSSQPRIAPPQGSRPSGGPGQGLSRSFATPRTVWALMLREMSTRYGKSPGGYVWAVLEPIGTIFLLALAFSLLIRSPSLGNSFILFYATGYLPFNLYQGISLMVARAILFSKPLLYYPAVTWMDSVLARFILNSLTGIMVAYLVMAIILGITETRTVLDLGPILEGFVLAMVLGLGVGMLNCALIGLYPTWDVIWSIATRPLFIASGVIFIYEDMPRAVQDVLWWNPLIHITGIVRSGVYPMYEPLYVSVPFVLVSALVPMALGLILLGRYHRDILERN